MIILRAPQQMLHKIFSIFNLHNIVVLNKVFSHLIIIHAYIIQTERFLKYAHLFFMQLKLCIFQIQIFENARALKILYFPTRIFSTSWSVLWRFQLLFFKWENIFFFYPNNYFSAD